MSASLYNHEDISDSSDNKNSEDLKKLRKYILGADSDETSNKKPNKPITNYNGALSLKKYNKIVDLCKDIEISVNNKHKKKTLQQFLDLCHKKRKSIIKNHIMEMAKFCTASGYEQLAGTYIIESKNDTMVSQLRCVDKIIDYIMKECQTDNNNIISLLNLKQEAVKKKKTTSKLILEEYSDNA